ESAGHRDAGARRDDGLRVRALVHRVLPRGVRAPHPRRAARRPAAVPDAGGGRALLEDPRPDHLVLGPQGQARAVRVGHVGPRVGGRHDGARRQDLEASMIIDMPDTTTNDVNKRLVRLRDEGGAVALGRVLTLVVLADDGAVEESVEAANDASRERPCGVIVVAPASGSDEGRVDAQIRVGGDAGASEVVVLRASGALLERADTLVMPLLLPDAPIVAWWPREAPAVPSQDPVGAMATRRIIDSTVAKDPSG